MTIPHLHNCAHKPDGWCLDCVEKLVEEQPCKLKSLEDSDKEILTQYYCSNLSMINIPNGIACPNCGAELVDKDRFKITMMKMPQTKIACPDCGYEGRRYL